MTNEEKLTEIITSQKAIDPEAPKRPVNPWSVMVIVIGIILLFQAAAWGVAIVFEAQEDKAHAAEVSDLRTSNTELRAQVTTLLANYDALSTDCEVAADCTTNTPDPALVEEIIKSIKIPTPPPGEPGRSPSQAEISAAVYDAVIAYCSNGACKGEPGKEGSPGASGTPGTAGANGVNGTDGANGNDGAQGPAGPPGADGAPGTPGTPGSDGRGISSVSCVLVDTLQTAFRFVFTDGSTQDVPASCIP
mgnify:CR=1 FL=1